jgi:hypothetical protein
MKSKVIQIKVVDVNVIYVLYFSYRSAFKLFKRLFSFFKCLSLSESITFLTFIFACCFVYPIRFGNEVASSVSDVCCYVINGKQPDSISNIFTAFMPGGIFKHTYKGLFLPKVVCTKYDVTWLVQQMGYIRFYMIQCGARCSTLGWGTMLQARRSRVRFPMRSLDF